jgi:hypothetical protein
VRVLSLSRDDLKRIPEDERILFVQLSYIHNTINVLRRWIISSRSDVIDRKPEFHAAITQQQLAGRFLVGVLFEGEKVLRKSLFGTQISRRYEAQLTTEGRRCQDTITTYFRRRNVIKAVRDRFAFHFDRSDVATQLNELPEDGSYFLYLTEEQGNSLYYLAEEIVGLAMLRVVGDMSEAGSPIDALKHLQNEMLEISGAFDRVVAEYLGCILTTYMPSATWESAAHVDLGDLPPINKIRTPFFVGHPSRD